MDKQIRIATRSSPLALAQAEAFRNLLLAQYPSLHEDQIEICPFMTAGDKQQEGVLSAWGYKGLFTSELEVALLQGEVDCAVHSLKDMPSVLPEGLVLEAVLPREDPRDALISCYNSLDVIPSRARFGTASLRRAAQIKRLRPDLDIVPLRGNVETRIRKAEEGEVAGTLLALAGLKRLGLERHAKEIFAPQHILPAVAQGAIGIECRADDAEVRNLLAALSHVPTLIAVTAERALLRALDGSCRTPIAGYATLEGDLSTPHARPLKRSLHPAPHRRR